MCPALRLGGVRGLLRRYRRSRESKMKKYVFIFLISVFAIIIGAIAFSYITKTESNKTTGQNSTQTTQQNEAPASNEEILYFYSDNCHWCQQQKPIVEELEKEGVKFKYMNIGENRDLINQYNIEGTPTFILGEKRLDGYKNKDILKKFWEENKK